MTWIDFAFRFNLDISLFEIIILLIELVTYYSSVSSYHFVDDPQDCIQYV